MVGTSIADHADPAIGVELNGCELYVSYMANILCLSERQARFHALFAFGQRVSKESIKTLHDI